jgi:hypothetical protein
MKSKKNRNGTNQSRSTFDRFLDQEGIREEVEVLIIKRVFARQLEEILQQQQENKQLFSVGIHFYFAQAGRHRFAPTIALCKALTPTTKLVACTHTGPSCCHLSTRGTSMAHKIVAYLLIPLLAFAACSVPTASAKTNDEKRALMAERVKEDVAELGAGADSIVKVRLRDHQKLTGYTSSIGEESFVVTSRDGTATTVAYSNVAQMSGRNFSTGQKIAIGVAIGVAVAAIAAAIIYKTQCGRGKIGC